MTIPPGTLVRTPDGPGTVLHTEGNTERTLVPPPISEAEARALAEFMDRINRGEWSIGDEMPAEFVSIVERARPAMELDGLVEVELLEFEGLESSRFYRPADLTVIE